jgi:hypothetical protein
MLAAVCVHGHEQPVFIDRDWWIFRHILAYLREGCLPESPSVLKQLYTESAFYKLYALREAVERRQGFVL